MHSGDMDGEGVWRWLRATRSSPPSPAAAVPQRRETYVAALEQAEQFFRAAATVGLETRPVLVFYGLSQAGRAIAAAAHAVEADEWRLQGHGIHAAAFDGPLPDVRVYADRAGQRGSFVRLSEMLGSPLWGKSDAVRFAALWDSLPENRLSPLDGQSEARRTPLYVEDRSIYEGRSGHEGPHPLISVPVCDFPPWVAASPDPASALRDYLAAFPGAHGYHSFVRTGMHQDASPEFRIHLFDGWSSLDMNWGLPAGQAGTQAERLAFWKNIPQPYGSARYFFPALGANSAGLHPLMAWWATLYTLSMLARYQPAEWGAHIDVNHSRYAVPIEAFLETAISFVPQLIAHTLDQVSDGELKNRDL